MKIDAHTPGFVDIDETPIDTFDNMEELLNLELVKRFTRDMSKYKFHRLSISDEMLMAEYDEGYVWWVIGYFRGPIDLDLPVWTPKYR